MKVGFLKIGFISLLMASFQVKAQEVVKGKVSYESAPFPGATVQLIDTDFGTISDAEGSFVITNIPTGKYTLEVRSVGFKVIRKEIEVPTSEDYSFILEESTLTMDEVVVTGTMHPTFVSQSPVKVDVITGSTSEHLYTSSIYQRS